jgi:hypothetical protein
MTILSCQASLKGLSRCVLTSLFEWKIPRLTFLPWGCATSTPLSYIKRKAGSYLSVGAGRKMLMSLSARQNYPPWRKPLFGVSSGFDTMLRNLNRSNIGMSPNPTSEWTRHRRRGSRFLRLLA